MLDCPPKSQTKVRFKIQQREEHADGTRCLNVCTLQRPRRKSQRSKRQIKFVCAQMSLFVPCSLMFLNCTVSTLKPIVGAVVKTSPSCNLKRMVVLPALSKPKINTLYSFDPKRRENMDEKTPPIAKISINRHESAANTH